MIRLAVKMHLPMDVQQVANTILAEEGTCACGRILRKLDAKFILANLVPSQVSMVIAAYCNPCFVEINSALKKCHRAQYQTEVPTAPVDRNIKKL